MKDELKEIREWLFRGIKYLQEESNIDSDAKNERIIAYRNAINKIEIMILQRDEGHE